VHTYVISRTFYITVLADQPGSGLLLMCTEGLIAFIYV
jgi:hypothetical protein